MLHHAKHVLHGETFLSALHQRPFSVRHSHMRFQGGKQLLQRAIFNTG